MKPTLRQLYRIHYINSNLPNAKKMDAADKFRSKGKKSGKTLL